MGVWVALFLFSTLFGAITAADEVVLTSSEKKNADEMDMTFGQADPVHIEEIKRETADDGAKKKRALELEPKLENAGKPEGEQSVLGPLTPLEETPQKDEVKPVPVKKSEEPPKELKKVEKRRQHRSRSKPSLAGSDKDGIEVA